MEREINNILNIVLLIQHMPWDERGKSVVPSIGISSYMPHKILNV